MHGSARIQEKFYPERRGKLRKLDADLPEDNLELAESVLKTLHFKGSVTRLSGSGLLARVRGKGTTAYVERVRLLKRLIDVFLAFVALMIMAPVMVVIAVIVKLDSKGPILYTQRRIGLRGTWFQALKFRTMCVDADERLKKLLDSDPEIRREFETFHKLECDPRVTRVGRFIRKHSLDELPQLVNVFKGEMALVGPRAYMPFEIVKIDRPRLNELLKVTPGLTGFWQVGGRSTVSFDERVDMDMFYIHNWSIGMDLYILVNTVWIVLFSRGYGSS